MTIRIIHPEPWIPQWPRNVYLGEDEWREVEEWHSIACGGKFEPTTANSQVGWMSCPGNVHIIFLQNDAEKRCYIREPRFWWCFDAELSKIPPEEIYADLHKGDNG